MDQALQPKRLNASTKLEATRGGKDPEEALQEQSELEIRTRLNPGARKSIEIE